MADQEGSRPQSQQESEGPARRTTPTEEELGRSCDEHADIEKLDDEQLPLAMDDDSGYSAEDDSGYSSEEPIDDEQLDKELMSLAIDADYSCLTEGLVGVKELDNELPHLAAAKPSIDDNSRSPSPSRRRTKKMLTNDEFKRLIMCKILPGNMKSADITSALMIHGNILITINHKDSYVIVRGRDKWLRFPFSS